jgi:hypothetical protein
MWWSPWWETLSCSETFTFLPVYTAQHPRSLIYIPVGLRTWNVVFSCCLWFNAARWRLPKCGPKWAWRQWGMQTSEVFSFQGGTDVDVFAETWRWGFVIPVFWVHSASAALALIHSRGPAPPAGARGPHVLDIISSSVSPSPLTPPPASPGPTPNTVSAAHWRCSVHSCYEISEAASAPGWFRAGRRRTRQCWNTTHGH